MVKAELGQKHTCQKCERRFYDLGNKPAVCPRCETVQRSPAAKRRSEPRPAPDTPKEKEDKSMASQEAEIVDELDEEVDAEDADEFIEDTSDLQDDDDVKNVIDKGPMEEGQDS